MYQLQFCRKNVGRGKSREICQDNQGKALLIFLQSQMVSTFNFFQAIQIDVVIKITTVHHALIIDNDSLFNKQYNKAELPGTF